MAVVQKHQLYLKLARSLPNRLTDFFRRHPPPALLQPSDQQQPTSHGNPFQPRKHPITGRWSSPIYSLRRQAELVKLARNYGVEELLPHGVKGTQERIRQRHEHGLRVKGTGVGQKVKGKAWERDLKGKLEKRRQAMLAMPQMIQDWKQVQILVEMLLSALTYNST
ncbi:MAG: hypothetical protein M1816_002991 [Peltula sp. TS41687]|nr:MAG: hypothetical protein M1816_002991 [Peltula sp. TS41687]